VGCLNEAVDEMMTEEVQTCSCDDQADDVLAKMTQGRFRHLPVIDGGRMIGLISIGDVVKARLSRAVHGEGCARRDDRGPLIVIGLYPGTFDPVTHGHTDIIRRACRLVDRLVIGVAINPRQGPALSPGGAGGADRW
jgi:hypothetical protein